MEYIKFIIDFILHIDIHLAELVAQYGVWVYAFLFLILFCETGLVVTPFLPGDSLLFVAGALAALPSNRLDIYVMVLLMVLAAIAGDMVNYTIGRLFGEELFNRPDSKIFRRSYLEKPHQFYARQGGKTIIQARFVPILRTCGLLCRLWPAWDICATAISRCTMSWAACCGFYYLSYAAIFLATCRWCSRILKWFIVAIILLSVLPGVVEVWRQRRMAANGKSESFPDAGGQNVNKVQSFLCQVVGRYGV